MSAVPLPEPAAWRSQSPVGGYHFSETRPTGAVEKYPQTPLVTLEDAIAYGAACAAEERERAIEIIEAYQVPVGNSAAGEMAAEWTMDALREIRDAIRASAMPAPDHAAD